jgi:hypothetical protein
MPLRAAAGLAAAAIDEARRLPDRLVGLPVLAVSTALQVSLKAQQRYAELVARGDQLLEQLRGQQQGTPAWARFDDEEAFRPGEARPSTFDVVEVPVEDVGPAEPAPAGGVRPPEADLSDLAEGLVPAAVDDEDPGAAAGARAEQADDWSRAGAAQVVTGGPRPEQEIDAVAADPSPYDGYLSAEPPLPNYDQLTLAQLRGKLRTLTEAQLVELVGYERGTAQRPAFLTMLENRLTVLRTR